VTQHYDLVVRGGTLIDGTGTPARKGDVAVSGGRIEAVGEVEGTATRTIDASGRAVAPGFVDVHTHYDAQIFWDRMLSVSPWHGVTSVVLGNCGFGIAPTRPAHRDLILRTLENVEGMSLAALQAGVGEDWPFETFPEYLDAIEERGSAINVGVMLGHTPLRMYVMGEESTEREATADEIAKMRTIVAEALAAGALGFATSKSFTHVGYEGRPVPSRSAAHEEVEALAACLGEAGHGILQATVGEGLFLDQFREISQRTGRPVTWTALLADLFPLEFQRSVLEQHAAMQAEGIQVYPQVACRPLTFEYQWKAPFPFEGLPLFRPVSAADLNERKRIYADPDFRRALRGEGAKALGGRWEATQISECRREPALVDRLLSEVAAERGVHPADLALDLALADDLEPRFRVVIGNYTEEAVAELLRHPAAALGLSDAGAHASQLCDACFSTHLLGYWVRDKQVLGLEEAVRLLTSRSAEIFGLHDRGRLERGLAADLVVFDPATVGCSRLRRVRDLPAAADRLIADAYGIDAVIVNGTVLRENGRDALASDGPLPGRVLRGGARA